MRCGDAVALIARETCSVELHPSAMHGVAIFVLEAIFEVSMVACSCLEIKHSREEWETILELRLDTSGVVGALVCVHEEGFSVCILHSCEDGEVVGTRFGIGKYLLDGALLACAVADAYVIELIPVSPEVVVVGTRRQS